MKRLALAVAAALMLAGCATATEGTVTSKQHTPAYTEYIPTCVGYGSNGMCSVWVPIPYDNPECYGVNFHNDAEDTEGSACVDPTEYDHYKLGDHYPRPR